MIMLSELYGRIGQILAEHGDMEVARLQSKIDGISTFGSGFMEYDNTDFFVHQTDVCRDNGFGKVVATKKRFVINFIGNGKRNKDKY